MRLKLITAPDEEPVTLAELKEHLRIYSDVTADDDLLEEIITSAREYVEEQTNRALLTQEWELYLDKWPDENYIRIPFGNLQEATVKYANSLSVETTLVEGTDYYLELNGDQLGRVVLPNNTSWPSDTLLSSNPIVVSFKCGWEDAEDIPKKYLTAIKMVASDLYENREMQSERPYHENMTINRLLSSVRLLGAIR